MELWYWDQRAWHGLGSRKPSMVPNCTVYLWGQNTWFCCGELDITSDLDPGICLSSACLWENWQYRWNLFSNVILFINLVNSSTVNERSLFWNLLWFFLFWMLVSDYHCFTSRSVLQSSSRFPVSSLARRAGMPVFGAGSWKSVEHFRHGESSHGFWLVWRWILCFYLFM